MDVFDKYLFDEITQDYSQNDLTSEDYEEIYQSFINIQHIPEVKPYLLAMRFLGYGIKADEESVLKELEECIKADDVILLGLYYDLILFRNKEDCEAAKKLLEYIDKGYSDIYLKEKSNVSQCSSIKKNNKKDYDKNIMKLAQRLMAVTHNQYTLEECYNKIMQG